MSIEIVTDKDFELLIKMLTHDLEKLVTITSRVLKRLIEGTLTLDNPRHRSLVESSGYAMERSRRMIEDLNETMTTRKLTVSMRHCSLTELMAEVAKRFAPMAENEDIRFKKQFCGPGTGMVHTDPALLIRIVENYLYNAISHTDSGGWIHLKVETEENGQYAISVCNSGLTIPDEELDRIFNVGVQLNLKQKRYFRGSGLGLAFCQMASTAISAQVGC
ncbi:MAG: hypothetical protein HQK65_04275, partial [Desulfamplus sp.]|nr:hypothetical protein [Desulfamplus sp.]